MNQNLLTIPDYFREKVSRVWKTKGELWLVKLPNLLTDSIQKWQLTECQVAENLSVNFICYAHSSQYGKVVLKTGVPHLELQTGIETLQLYQGNHACKLYEKDRENGIVLLEMILPGNQLKGETDFRKRMQVGTTLAKHLPLKLNGNSNQFPTFEAQLKKAITKVRQAKQVSEEFLEMLNLAEDLYQELKQLQREQFLLHGDLHHENILQDHTGAWRVIDPQGRIGESCLEVGRFLLNEWEWFEREDSFTHMAESIDIFADVLGESRRLIAISCYMDCALSRCWALEDGAGKEEIEEALRFFKGIQKFF